MSAEEIIIGVFSVIALVCSVLYLLWVCYLILWERFKALVAIPLKRFFPKHEDAQVPSVTSLVQAADEQFYDSAIFSAVHDHTCCSTIESVLDAFAEALKEQPLNQRTEYTSEVLQYVFGRKYHKSGRRPSNLSSATDPLDVIERGLGDARFEMTRYKPKLIRLPRSQLLSYRDKEWMSGFQQVKQSGEPVQLALTPSALVAFSIFLGTPLLTGCFDRDGTTPQEISEPGAFGISLQTSRSSDGTRRFHLHRHPQDLSERVTPFSMGYSGRFSKIITCGCLPLPGGRKSLYFSSNTFTAIRTGDPRDLHGRTTLLTLSRPGLSFLCRLPNRDDHLVDDLKNLDNGFASPRCLPEKLLDGLSMLALSTPPPMASTTLVSTISFIASGGLPPGRLLQRLECIVEKLYHFSPSHIELFGELYYNEKIDDLREKSRLGTLGASSEESEARALESDTTGRKMARVARWNVVLQRLMGMLVEKGDHREDDVIYTVKNAVKKQFEESYEAALKAEEAEEAEIDTWKEDTETLVDELEKSEAEPMRTSSRRTDTPSLATQVEEILNLELPFEVDTIATLARLMLVGWCNSAVRVAWEDREEGLRLHIPLEIHNKMVLM